jgi:hypothetical protein
LGSQWEGELVSKLVWRVKLVAELQAGVTTEVEVGRFERDEQASVALVHSAGPGGSRMHFFLWFEHPDATQAQRRSPSPHPEDTSWTKVRKSRLSLR